MLSEKLQRKRSYSFLAAPSIRRRLPLLVAVILCYILIYHLPEPPKTQNNNQTYIPPPEYDVVIYPRFLHRSPFRTNPDLVYEARLERVLRGIERDALLEDGDDRAKERIWQIMRSERDREPDSIALERENVGWEYTAVTDEWAMEFITKTLSKILDLETLYRSYPYNVLRADLLRYLVLWFYGGYYADMDVFPARSIKSCPSLDPLFINHSKRNVSLVVGIEIDEPYSSPRLMRDWHWSRSYGFIQYNMYAPRRFSPFLRKAIVRVLAHTKKQQEQRSLLRSSRYDEKTILEVTGPGAFTDAILDTLSETLSPTHELINASIKADKGIGDLISFTSGTTRRRVTWGGFHKLQEPIWIDASEAQGNKTMGGLGVLPISVWGNGQRHSGAEGFEGVHACINHQFGRTWKKGWWEYFFG